MDRSAALTADRLIPFRLALPDEIRDLEAFRAFARFAVGRWRTQSPGGEGKRDPVRRGRNGSDEGPHFGLVEGVRFEQEELESAVERRIAEGFQEHEIRQRTQHKQQVPRQQQLPQRQLPHQQLVEELVLEELGIEPERQRIRPFLESAQVRSDPAVPAVSQRKQVDAGDDRR